MKKLPPQNEGKDKGFQIPELVRLPADSRTCPPTGGFQIQNMSGGLSPEGAK